jgi:hypothetical protein
MAQLTTTLPCGFDPLADQQLAGALMWVMGKVFLPKVISTLAFRLVRRGKEVQKAVMDLPVHYRETWFLVIMLTHSYEDAAKACGVAVGTIKRRVNRARLLLQKRFDDDQAC